MDIRAEQDAGLSLVAADANRIVGHVMFTLALLDAPRRLVVVQVLSPIAVRPERQSQGVGGTLIRQGLRLMASRGVPMVFLEGSPGYYSRFGFESGAQQAFPQAITPHPRRCLPGL